MVIPCRDRTPSLRACLESVTLAKASVCGADVEIVIVDDRSQSPLATELGTSFSRVRFLPAIGIGPGAARNTALKQLDTDAIMFTDSDCVVARDWIAVGLKWLIEQNEPIAQGIPWLFRGNVNPDLARLEETLYRHMFSTYIDRSWCEQTDTRNLVVRRARQPDSITLMFPDCMEGAAAEARVFGQQAKREGVRISWLPTLKVAHEDPVSFEAILKQKQRHGSGRVHVWDQLPPLEHLVCRYFVAPVEAGLPESYVVPAHLAFLHGYHMARGGQDVWWTHLITTLSSLFDPSLCKVPLPVEDAR